MNELYAAMKILLANTYVMYFRAHSYHWNVEGPNFNDYHQFFGTLYGEVYGAIDPTAEEIRACDQYAPISLADLLSAKTIDEDASKPTSYDQMFANLERANNAVVEALNTVRNLATANGKFGLVNFIEERLDVHAKHGWMIRSLSKAGN